MTTYDSVGNEEVTSRRFPLATLNVDEISHHMAARLTSTLLGHMLYMKGQIPFPVNSIGRMSAQRYSGDFPPRDDKLAKKRKEFLDAYDDLRSHLETTFVALSTAYAHNPAFVTPKEDLSLSEGETHFNDVFPNYRSAKIHLFLVVGPSLTLPKARVLLELNNFHVEKFGEREFLIRQLSKASSYSDDGNSEGEDDGENESSAEEAESGDEESADDVATVSDTEEVDSRHFFALPSTPRRTASVYPASVSPSSEPPNTPSSGTSESSEELEQSSPETSLSEDQIVVHDCRHPGDSFCSDEDESLRDCERSLSKALLRFGEALGFEDELAPTQTHILIRAPRRFSHPTWVPRQNLTPSFNKIMDSLINSDGGTTRNNRNKAKKSPGTLGSNTPTVGLRVVCQSASQASEGNNDQKNAVDELEDDIEEMDELIWWSWDGKLVGFSGQ